MQENQDLSDGTTQISQEYDDTQKLNQIQNSPTDLIEINDTDSEISRFDLVEKNREFFGGEGQQEENEEVEDDDEEIIDEPISDDE